METFQYSVSSLLIIFKNKQQLKFPYVRYGTYVVKAQEGSDELVIERHFKENIIAITTIPNGKTINSINWQPLIHLEEELPLLTQEVS